VSGFWRVLQGTPEPARFFADAVQYLQRPINFSHGDLLYKKYFSQKEKSMKPKNIR